VVIYSIAADAAAPEKATEKIAENITNIAHPSPPQPFSKTLSSAANNLFAHG
jgi:hypothetical protein